MHIPLLQGMSSGRVTVAGKMALLEGADAADAKKAFLAKNPNSFWVEFGDFAWFRMDSVATARLVGGFGRIKQVLPTSPPPQYVIIQDVMLRWQLCNAADGEHTRVTRCLPVRRSLQRNLQRLSPTQSHNSQAPLRST